MVRAQRKTAAKKAAATAAVQVAPLRRIMTVTCEEVVTVFRGPRVILMGLLPGKVIATPIAVAQRIGNGFDNRWELKAVMPNLPVGIRHFDGTFVTDADHKALSAGAGATVGPTWSRCVIRQDPATYKGAADLLAEWVANQEEDEDEEQEVEASVEPEPEAAAQAAKDTKQAAAAPGKKKTSTGPKTAPLKKKTAAAAAPKTKKQAAPKTKKQAAGKTKKAAGDAPKRS